MRSFHFFISLSILSLFIWSCGSKSQDTALSQKDGKYIYSIQDTFPSGKTKHLIRFLVSDTTQAIETYYHESGKKFMEGPLLHMQRNGEWTAWDENGAMMTQGHYKMGIDDGYKVVYYPNGKIRYEGQYQDSVPFGKWTFYNAAGEVIKIKNYSAK